MTDIIAQIEQAEKAATPGPWENRVIWNYRPEDDYRQKAANERFIALSREAVPALLARIRELEAALEQAEDLLIHALGDGLTIENEPPEMGVIRKALEGKP